MHLSGLLGSSLATGEGESFARVDDVIVHVRGEHYPLVTGLVARVERRRVFVPARRISAWQPGRVVLSGSKLDLTVFARRPGEVLLRDDILGHRLIDVTEAELVRAYDVELAESAEGLVVRCLDTRRPARLMGLLRQGAGHPCRDWKSFEPLIEHASPVTARASFGRVRRLKPAQIADLLEDADRAEGATIMRHVHADPDLEADVFEELEPDLAARLLNDRSDTDVVDILSRMRADDAADALADLPQRRRQQLLEALPLGQRTKVLTLMGFNPASAGGLMTIDVLTVGLEDTVASALAAVRAARSLQPEALNTLHAVDADGRLLGTASLVALVQADLSTTVREVLDHDPVRVTPETDIADVSLLMADYNLCTIPVVDRDRRLLGMITFDDVLEATIPDDWRRREPATRPEAPQDLEQPAPSPGVDRH